MQLYTMKCKVCEKEVKVDRSELKNMRKCPYCGEKLVLVI